MPDVLYNHKAVAPCDYEYSVSFLKAFMSSSRRFPPRGGGGVGFLEL